MDRCCAFRGRFEGRLQHTKGGRRCRPRRVTGGAARVSPSFTVPAGGISAGRRSVSTYLVRQGLAAPEDESAVLMPPLLGASRKRGITAGQRGGQDKVGSRSLPKPGNDRD